MEIIEKITGETGRKYKCQDIVKALEANIVGSQLEAGVETAKSGLEQLETRLPLPGFGENRPPGAAASGRPEADPPGARLRQFRARQHGIAAAQPDRFFLF